VISQGEYSSEVQQRTVTTSGTVNAAARVRAVSAEAPADGESALGGPGFPAVVLAAAVLAAEQVSGVLVGSAALWLRGEPVSVGDVDVVIERASRTCVGCTRR
jgi:hypothetical protein